MRSRTIPRYFFHLVKGGETVLRDVTGHDCADDRAARRHAKTGDNLIASPTLASAALKDHSIQVVNETGQTVCTVPLSDLEPRS